MHVVECCTALRKDKIMNLLQGEWSCRILCSAKSVRGRRSDARSYDKSGIQKDRQNNDRLVTWNDSTDYQNLEGDGKGTHGDHSGGVGGCSNFSNFVHQYCILWHYHNHLTKPITKIKI